MIWLIIYPLLIAFSIGILKKYIKNYIDWIVLISFIIYSAIVIKTTRQALVAPLNYQLGSWNSPLGIRLSLAANEVLLIWLVVAIIFMVLIYSTSYIIDNKAKYHILILILVAAMMGLIMTADLFNLYVFFEITSIVSYGLAAINKERDSFEGVLKYLIIGVSGGLFILLAIILTYQLTGSLDLATIAAKMKVLSQFQRHSILALFLVGFGSKIAIVPLHTWMPDVYNCSNIVFNALSSALIIKIILYGLVKVIYKLFGSSFWGSRMQWIVLWWCVISFLVAHLLAYQQQNIKRLLAYSSVAHIAYLVVAFSLGTEDGLIAGNFHLLNHALMKSSLFLLSGILALQINSYQLDDWRGLSAKLPLQTFLFTGVSLAMIGLPPFNGFLSKFLIIRALIDEGYLLVGFAILLGTLLSLVYYLKIIQILYSKNQSQHKNKQQPQRLTVVSTVLASSCLVIGLFPTPILELINKTTILLGG
ncbi:MAG: complex I subunit 5 family protein [Bacillota bacterium]